MADADYIAAHKHSIRHRDEIMRSEICGCFFCMKSFSPKQIAEWIDETTPGVTALCPFCGIDSVIGSASGYPITNEFLAQMESYWFNLRNAPAT